MDLSLDISGIPHKRGTQFVRVLTERWFERNMFCPACQSDYLKKTATNTKVIDFFCPMCDEKFQLKSFYHPLGAEVVDSAYKPKIDAIKNGTIPNFAFLHYDNQRWVVKDLVLVPRYFIYPELIKKRKPLKRGAKRAGWVGSTIVMSRLPSRAKIAIVHNGYEISREDIRKMWKDITFVKDLSLSSKGWLSDVMACIEKMDKEVFSLQDIYSYREELARLHPKNRNIEAKIRQQLQLLRDRGVIEFLGKGRYNVGRSLV